MTDGAFYHNKKIGTQIHCKWNWSSQRLTFLSVSQVIIRPVLIIGMLRSISRRSKSADTVLSKNGDRESRLHDVKWWCKIHDTFLSARQNKLAKMASPVWQYFKVCEKDNKIAVCNVCVKQKSCSSTRCDGPVSRAEHTLRVRPNTLSYFIYLCN